MLMKIEKCNVSFLAGKILYLVLFSLLLSACGSKNSGSIEYLPAKVDKNDKWGLVSPEGEMLISDEYETQPSAVINGYFIVKENGGYSVYKADKKPELVKGLEELKSVGIMTEGLIPVCKKGQRIEFVNGKGKTDFTLTPVDNKEIVSVSIGFNDGLAIISNEDGRKGAINTSGKVVIKPSFDILEAFHDGYAIAYNNKDGGMEAMIVNKKGEVVVKVKDNLTILSLSVLHKKVVAEKDGECGFLNLKGEFTKAPSKVKEIKQYNEKFYVYRSDEYKYGVMNFDGEVVVRAKYGSIYLRDDKFICVDDHKGVILDTKGDEITTIEDIRDLEDMRTKCLVDYDMDTKFDLLVKDGKDLLFYNEKGESISKESFRDIGLVNLTISVNSDFINLDAITKQLTDQINENGVGKVKFGDQASKHITEKPSTLSRSFNFSVPGFDNGLNYNIMAAAIATTNLVNSKAVYTTHNLGFYSYKSLDHYEYSFNEEARVKNFKINVSLSDEYYKELFEKVGKSLKDKGFKVVKESSGFLYCTKGKSGVIVAPNGSKREMLVSVYNIADIKNDDIEDLALRAKNTLSGESSECEMDTDYIIEESFEDENY